MYSRKHYLKVFEEAKLEMPQIEAAERAKACGFELLDDGATLTMSSLNRTFYIDSRTWEMKMQGGRPMPLQLRILTMHYIKKAPGVWRVGELSPLRKLPGLEMYGPVVSRRSEDILVKSFGEEPELLFDVMKKVGGEKVDMGDAGGRFIVLPKMPMTVMIHGAEPGLPAEASVMMDSRSGDVLHLEDLVVMAELLSHKLVNVALEMKRG